MAQHRAISPDDCPRCRQVFAALEERQIRDPEAEITTREIGQAAGLKERATQVHLRHLFEHSRIDADRRTPLSGVGQPVLPGAQAWAASVTAPDPTCAKCLVALAGWGWDGQVDVKELAAMAGVSVRSVERHRPHLVDFDLVRFRSASIPAGGGVFNGAKPAHFTLMSGFYARALNDAERAEVPARAAAVIDRVRWFVGVTEAERELAAEAVGFVLRAGWPDEAILKALDASEDRNAFNPSGYLHKLLGKLRGKRYLIPAQHMFTGAGAPRVGSCWTCKDAVKTTKPEGSKLWCGGTYCLNAGTVHDTSTVRPIHRTRTA
ncbi:hypothetical protein [Streptomyces sp. H27-H5]|uniref:hypothetical protein n=1 Tax=Streptomyces sp. H27-H5 TaxID=2996460 RepID=UPI00226F704D|nr:hypothetical protein [Streptomyces sp. H27-H5]MCY0961462.1 hypothetical protein [Streptomyces sp. H27-H5]